MYFGFIPAVPGIWTFCMHLISFQVLVPKDCELMGKSVDVVITKAGKHFMKAELASNCNLRRPDNVPPPLSHGEVSGATTEPKVSRLTFFTCTMCQEFPILGREVRASYLAEIHHWSFASSTLYQMHWSLHGLCIIISLNKSWKRDCTQ
jgi:hypothetical protein